MIIIYKNKDRDWIMQNPQSTTILYAIVKMIFISMKKKELINVNTFILL